MTVHKQQVKERALQELAVADAKLKQLGVVIEVRPAVQGAHGYRAEPPS